MLVMAAMAIPEGCPMHNKKFGTKNERENLHKKVHTAKQLKRSTRTGVHRVTPEVKAKLANKHPQTPPEYEYAEKISVADRPIVKPATMDEVVTAIKRFLDASAGGDSVMTITRVRKLVDTNEAHDEGGLSHALASVLTKWLKGQALPRLAEWMASAPLTPLPNQTKTCAS